MTGVARGALVLTAAVLGLTACGSASGSRGAATSTDPPRLHLAPEPAVAPTATTAPAGTVVALGAQEPEGIVADPVSGVLAVATRRPGQLLIIDGRTLAVTTRVSTVGAARHLQLAAGGGAVLVPGEDTATVSTVALPGGTVTAKAATKRQPHDATPVDGLVVDTDELAGSVTATRGDATLQTVPGLVQPGGLVASGGRVAVVDVRSRLLDVYAVDPASPTPLTLVGTVVAGQGPTHVVDLGGGVVAVADTSGGTITVVDVGSGDRGPRVLQTLPLPGRPYGMAVDHARHRLWVATGSDNTLHELSVSGTTLAAGASRPTVQQPNSLAVEEATGRVVVAGATPAGTLEAIDP